MSKLSAPARQFSNHQIQQAIKWTVYGLLLINFGFYIIEDWTRASFVLTESSTLLAWTKEFATSIDESAWFLLLFMFELETYTIEDKDWGGWLGRAIRAVRLVCFVMIAHTVFAFYIDVSELSPTKAVADVSNLCDLSNDDVSYVYNLKYTTVSAETCASLSDAAEFYWVGNDPVVSDLAGLNLERDLALADLIEAVAWLIVILAIEITVRLQSRGTVDGRVFATAKYTKWVLYALLLGLGVYWANLSHWLYLWDEILWIGGFSAIEMNVNEWRDELLATQTAT